MGDTTTTSSTVLMDAFRSLLSLFDRPAYWLLGIVYQLFFNVASADIFANATIMKFYGRVQLILGVFMMFQLAMTILKGIVDPDSFTNEKSGASNLIMRIATSLIMLTLIVPISIPNARNEYEIQINNNGLLFGTLYSLQHRILSNNTLGRLILGTDGVTNNYVSADAEEDELETSARIFTSTVLKGFYRINLLPENERPKHEDGKDDAVFNDNRMCQDIDDEILAAYTRLDAEPGDIIGMVNETCEPDFSLWNHLPIVSAFAGNKKYVFTYNPFISMIVGFVFVFILLSFTIDVAVRAVKLAILRLLAPIPIISYMDPKGSKDNAFNSWVKTLSSTYLDLFIRLAIVYFVIFLIQDMIINGVYINKSGGAIGILSLIIIWIGLFIFAKQAPKFIKQVLGLKDDGGSIFGNAAAFGLSLGGAVGSGLASARASRLADETRSAYGIRDALGHEINPNSAANRAKHLLAGIAGGVGGAVTGIGAAANAKDHRAKASLEAMQKRNAEAIAKGNDGSTVLGRWGSTIRQYGTGDGASAADARKIATNKARIDSLKAIKSRVSSEMVKSDWSSGSLGIATDQAGNSIGNVNFKKFEANLAAGRSRGDGLVHFEDTAGVSHTISIDDAERQRGFLLKNNEDDFITQHVSGTAPKVDDRLVTLIHNAEEIGGSSDFTRRPDGTIEKGSDKHITNRASINDAIDGFEDYNTYLDRRNAVNKANDRYSSKK